jgi:hypothetical protein
MPPLPTPPVLDERSAELYQLLNEYMGILANWRDAIQRGRVSAAPTPQQLAAFGDEFKRDVAALT